MYQRDVDSEETSFYTFVGKKPQRRDLKLLPQSLCLNLDQILSYTAWKNPLLIGETQ